MSTAAHAHPSTAYARRRSLPQRLSPLRRLRRVITFMLVLCSIPIGFSYVGAVTGPSNSSFTIRSFEWLRDHGAARSPPGSRASTLDERALDRWRRSATLPLTSAKPKPPSTRPTSPRSSPPACRAKACGLQRDVRRGNSPVQVTQFRSDPLYPQMVAGVAWINTSRTWVSLYPGRLEPSVSLPRGPMMVPDAAGGGLPTFNSGFELLTRAAARPRRPDVCAAQGWTGHGDRLQGWPRGHRVLGSRTNGAGDVSYARQNLPLIVIGGRPNPNLSDGPEWGPHWATLSGLALGLGVDAHGNLIYAGADDETVGSLAQILIHAGAVRAMQLDINSYWVTFISYASPFAGRPTSLLPTMTRSPQRYFSPDDRDSSPSRFAERLLTQR